MPGSELPSQFSTGGRPALQIINHQFNLFILTLPDKMVHSRRCKLLRPAVDGRYFEPHPAQHSSLLLGADYSDAAKILSLGLLANFGLNSAGFILHRFQMLQILRAPGSIHFG